MHVGEFDEPRVALRRIDSAGPPELLLTFGTELERPAVFFGQVQEFSMDYLGSLSGDGDVWTYNVKGSKWNGRVTVRHETGDDGNEHVIWAKFTLPSGEVVELKPDEGAAN